MIGVDVVVDDGDVVVVVDVIVVDVVGVSEVVVGVVDSNVVDESVDVVVVLESVVEVVGSIEVAVVDVVVVVVVVVVTGVVVVIITGSCLKRSIKNFKDVAILLTLIGREPGHSDHPHNVASSRPHCNLSRTAAACSGSQDYSLQPPVSSSRCSLQLHLSHARLE